MAMKNLPDQAIQGVVRGASAVGANVVSNQLGARVPAIPLKLHGPVLFAAGLAMEAFIENDYASSVGQGFQVAGVQKAANDFVPDVVKDKIGLSGLGEIAIDSTPESWEELAELSAAGSEYTDLSVESMQPEEIAMPSAEAALNI